MTLRGTAGLRRFLGPEGAVWEEMERGWAGAGVVVVEAVNPRFGVEVEVGIV